MANGGVSPISRFWPSRGIMLDRTQKSVTITGLLEAHGPAATPAIAHAVQTSINTTWSAAFPDGYTASCRIVVAYRGPGSNAKDATQIEVLVASMPSHVGWGTRGRYMTLNAAEPMAFSWIAAHEFGHLLGLDDRYSESILGRLGGLVGHRRQTIPQSGYNGNLMGTFGGALSSRNLADLATENEPSPCWIDDDDYVADWVNGHAHSEIGRLIHPQQGRAIHTLLSAWVSHADLCAVARICESVGSRTEADAIRKAVDVLRLTDIGQRTSVRLALSRMP